MSKLKTQYVVTIIPRFEPGVAVIGPFTSEHEAEEYMEKCARSELIDNEVPEDEIDEYMGGSQIETEDTIFSVEELRAPFKEKKAA